MFSENHRISDRQLQALLLTDWVGTLLLLQPGLTGGYPGGSVLLGTIAGLAAAALLLFVLLRSAWSAPVDYYSYVKKHGGRGSALLVYLLYGIYFLEQTVLLLFLCGEIGRTYLLPETGKEWLLLFPAAAGYFLTGGGLEVRGRVSEVLAWFLSILLLLMLAGSLGESSRSNLQAALWAEREGFLESFYDTAAGFAGMLALPLAVPGIEQRKGWKKKQYLAFGTAGVLLLLAYTAGYGLFGEMGMERLSWPVLTLMSSPGGRALFLQRLDVLATAVLLTCLFLSVGSSLFYMELVIGTLFGKKTEMGKKWIRLLLLLISCLLALGIRDWEQALFFYRRISLWFCVPLLMLMILTVKMRKRGRRLIRITALFLAGAVLLTGCTARELEERCFPLVLEVDAADGMLNFGCAWPNVKDEDGKLTQNSSENGTTEEITRVSGESLEEALEKVQNLQEKYVDYSQVKVILWGDGMEDEVLLAQEVLQWLEGNPLFSADILVFQEESEDLNLEMVQEHAQGQPGEYLEKLYENNPSFQEHTKRLYEFLYNLIDKKITV